VDRGHEFSSIPYSVQGSFTTKNHPIEISIVLGLRKPGVDYEHRLLKYKPSSSATMGKPRRLHKISLFLCDKEMMMITEAHFP
jgi:hypothetical protein